MSRNIRQKYPHTTVKAAKRRGSDTSSLNLSDDDDDDNGYSAVEDVSDSDEDDEEHVFAAEEEHIINASRKRSMGTPRPPEPEDDDADEEADEDDDDEVDDDDDAADENASWDGILTEPESNATEQLSNYFLEQEMASVERHVRFTGVPDSDSDSTTSETSEDHQDLFPDIFIEQNALDPAFRREIENDDDSSHSGSFWDFHTNSQDLMPVSDDERVEESDSTPIATPLPSGMVTVASTPTPPAEAQELDGYETDGDTTEEDVPEPPIRRKQMRRVNHVEPSSDSETDKPTPMRHGKPRIGRFNLDKSERKPIAVVNPSTRKMMIFTPQRLSRLDLSPESFQVDFSARGLNGEQQETILSNPGYVMMGAMLSSSTFGDHINTLPFGPAEAFFPLTSDPVMGEDSDDSEFSMPAQDDEECKLKLEDFITFHHDSSDEEEEESGLEYGDVASSPTRPQTAASSASAATDSSMAELPHPLLTHFDNNSDAVGAFRRNQITQQLIYSDKASSESLAFSTPYHYGALRGIKNGSMEAVTAPITPARRHKRSNTMSIKGFDLQGSPQQKRKASSTFTDSLHKKQRSISELGVLQI
ncbi:hypothetical protein B0T16DRAFT_139489 [Cercophora newfieldiana]|uniref:Uncharacterized protein n=1 Tax=Cercophora newfieldiana TaxID=92897 RepID=A0AA39Y6G1_9PEZI|nr:hypothetical protein B0T16DRAFT_139489 [Cercophora newfieldiana]